MADERTSARRNRGAPIQIGAVVALALAVAFVVWLVVRGNDNSSSAPNTTTAETRPRTGKQPRQFVTAATPARLRVLARASGHPIYWAGQKGNVRYELTQTTDGRIYIRYLPRGVPLGDRRSFLIVATYPVKDAYKAVQTAAKQSGAVTFRIARGGLAVYNRSAATNVYFAYPDSKYQVEVFDPNPTRARRLVSSGAVRPIA